MTTQTETGHKVVSQQEWTQARLGLLEEEKQLSRQRDEVNRKRLQLPWVKVEKPYRFQSTEGAESLGGLFGTRSQLLVYHFMMGPGWVEGCKSCSFLGDHFDATTIHLAARDVTFVVVSRAPLNQIQAFKKRMGWKFNWVSSFESEFNYDFGVSFLKDDLAKGAVPYNYTVRPFGSEEAPGASAFYKDESGTIFHTYSTYARGLDMLIGTYHFLDIAPQGRDEDALAFSMSWVRHHDRYDENYRVDPAERYVPVKVQIGYKTAENGE